MKGCITLIGAGELMSTMSSQHRMVLGQVKGQPRPVFLDTTAGFETNIDTIVAKAVDYYNHHLQTDLRVARYRHRDRTTRGELAEAIAEIRGANLIFAGPGSPTYAIAQWRNSPLWDAVVQQFETGTDVLFASAASITLGRYALPVYEIYKAGADPYWSDGLDLLGRMNLKIAVVPHFNDGSGGDNYDSRFCYMGARRFDQLQASLPSDVTILGIDAYTAIRFDPESQLATVSGQGSVTLLSDGMERRISSGESLCLDEFHSTSRKVVRTDDGRVFGGYEFSDEGTLEDEVVSEDPFGPILGFVDGLDSLEPNEQIELMTFIHELRVKIGAVASSDEAPIVNLALELRDALRSLKRFDLADRARKRLEDLGYEIGDSPQGSTWTRR